MSQAQCRALVSERSGGFCEVRTKACRGMGESMHHRRKAGQGGLWTAANIVHVCGDGTVGCHGYLEANPATARKRGLWLYTGQLPLVTAANMVFRGLTAWYLLDDEGSITWLSRRGLDRVSR